MHRILATTSAFLISATCAASNTAQEAPSPDSGSGVNTSCTSAVSTHKLSSGTSTYSEALRFNDANPAIAPGLLDIRLPPEPEVIFLTVKEPVACGVNGQPGPERACETLGCTEEILGNHHVAPGTQVSMEACGGGGMITNTWTRSATGSWTITAVSAEQHARCGPIG